jgi:hypothetical protein
MKHALTDRQTAGHFCGSRLLREEFRAGYRATMPPLSRKPRLSARIGDEAEQ